MSKGNYRIIEQMREDLLTTYRRVAPKVMTQMDAWRKTVNSPAPRYYVSPKQAYQKVAPMLKGDFKDYEQMTPIRRKMYKSIFDEVLRASQRREFIGKSLWFIIPWVVTQPAPEFFILPQTMKKMFSRKKHGRYTKDGRMILTDSFIRAQAKLREKRRLAKEASC